MVVISHFHGDHINGLIKPDGSPAFPNAEILVPTVEWKYFMDDAEMSRQTTDRMKEVFAGTRTVFDALKRKVTQYEPGKDVAPGITSVPTSVTRRAMCLTWCRPAARRFMCRPT